MVRKIKLYKLFEKLLICLLRVLLVILWLFDDIILTISLPNSSTCVWARWYFWSCVCREYHFVNIKIYSISTNVVHYTMISLPLTLVYCMSRPSKFLDIIFVFLEVSTDKIRNCNCHKIVRGQIGNQILLIEFLWRKLCSFLSVCKRYLYSFLKYQVTKLKVIQYYHYVLYVYNIFIICRIFNIIYLTCYNDPRVQFHNILFIFRHSLL